MSSAIVSKRIRKIYFIGPDAYKGNFVDVEKFTDCAYTMVLDNDLKEQLGEILF